MIYDIKLDKYRRFDFDDYEVWQIKEFAKKMASAKSAEEHHRTDGRSELTRLITGLMGEAAVEKLLGIKIIEWEIGDSRRFNHADISEYGVGVKTAEIGKFPVIFKQNDYPQIICVRKRNSVYVCGLATPDVLNDYQSDEDIVDERLRARGTKTAFVGFEHLIEINSVKDLKTERKKTSMLNVVAIQGRMVANPELRVTESGVSVCSFTIASDRSFVPKGEERQADFIDCVAWRNTAEFISKYFLKGSMILVNGALQTRNFEDKNGNKRKSTEVIVEQANFCGKSESSDSKPEPTAKPDTDVVTDDADDLPF